MHQRPIVFFLHALGGSARAWDGVVAALGADVESVPIDLPGFGDASAAGGLGVLDMVDHVVAIVRGRRPDRWMLVGHSMGGKVASVVASMALSGEPGLFGLAGVVLLAASPPSPEPMDETRRATMIGWASQGPLDAAAAREFIDANVGAPLAPADDAAAVHDLRRASPDAWLAWLQRGSREDWSATVGTLDLPALIIAGGADGDLGEAGQRATNAVVYRRSRIVVEAGAGHLLPLERARSVADAILHFWHEVAGTAPPVPTAFVQLIDSDRVSRRMRGALAIRSLADAPDPTPRALTAAQFATLRAVADRTVPQSAPAIDLAARLDAQLARGTGDGWRFASLPADADACRHALDALVGFEDLPPDAQDARLAEIVAGTAAVPSTSDLSSAQMALWFEDLRTDLVRLWLAHPATLARIGFDGFANGGDGIRKQGFDRVGAEQREAWEPIIEAPR